MVKKFFFPFKPTLILSLAGMIIIFFSPVSGFAIDSTNPEVIPPPMSRQCYTVQANGNLLRLNPQTINADVRLTGCTWRGQNNASWWAAAITNATYEQGCQAGEVAVGVRHGLRGDFFAYGEYDLYVNCCTLDVTISMSQNWYPCP